MRKINRQDVLKLVLVLALVAGIGFAMGSIGRFVPTHKIVQPVYCGSCHPEQVEELNETTHLGDFAERIERAVEETNPTLEKSAAEYVSGGCQMCHNYWDNFKWFGLKNVAVDVVEGDVPALGMIQSEGNPTDIYGNAVSPYGLGSTKSYVMNVTGRRYDSATYPSNWNSIVVAWPAGLDVYQYTYGNTTYSRLDYVWSRLSALSPGPVGFRVLNGTNPAGAALAGCGTAEKGLCHAATDAVALSMLGAKREFPEFPNLATNGSNGTVSGINPQNMTTLTGSGVFFQHEMAFTTAQYAAKPVKICGSCHVFKLPPMRWGGEPWAVKDVWDYSNGNYPNSDPFGFRPTYNDLTGEANVESHVGTQTKEFNVMFRTPDWAHSNVPCIRCHVHAGINNKLVSGNEADLGGTGSYVSPGVTIPSPGSPPDAQYNTDYISPDSQ
jgi:hypothetical protein